MFILKNFNYNKYFKEIAYIFLLFIISSIPWIEFMNSNFNEFEFIFNDNFFILINLYFTFILLTYFFFKYFLLKTDLNLVCSIGIIIWLLFQHNLLRNKIYEIFKNSFIGKYNSFFSEATLVLILVLIVIFVTVLNKKKFFRLFVIFFLMFNFIYSSALFSLKLKSIDKNITLQNSDQIYSALNKKNNPNIYFFLVDAMMPLNEFENFYRIDLNNFKNYFEKHDYTYFKNTKNFYQITINILTSFFSLEENIHTQDLNSTKKLKPNIYKRFPGILESGSNPKLITELHQLGYKFKWIGNRYADCSRHNYEYCLYNKKENYIDIYLLQAFLEKSPFVKIFNKIFEFGIFRNFFNVNYNQDAILKFDSFIKSNKSYLKKNKPVFYFIHDLEPHWPYKVDSNCNYKNFQGNLNYEGYKESYLCATNKILKIIETIEIHDPDSKVIFQSDHNWEMSLQSKKEYGDRKNIFNLIKNNVVCKNALPDNPNNVNITEYLLTCLKI